MALLESLTEATEVKKGDKFYIVQDDLDKQADIFLTTFGKRANLVGTDIDWSSDITDFEKTLTANITITDSNLPSGDQTKVIVLNFTGDFAITFPAYWKHFGGTYDGTVNNMIVVYCLNGGSGVEDIRYIIHNEQ